MPAAVFPTLSWGDVFLCPSTRKTTAAAQVVRFLDDTEQRWRGGDILEGWTLSFTGMNWADVVLLQNFVATVKGAYDGTWTFPFLGTNYTNMAFEQDDLTAIEQATGLFDVTLQFRQTVTIGGYPATATVYPALGTSAVVQRPFTGKEQWLTTRNDLPSGARYSWAERGAWLGCWTIEYQCLTETELGALFGLYCAMGGQYGEFAFTDPNTGIAHPHCRFDMNALAVRYLGAGQYSTTVQIAEYVV